MPLLAAIFDMDGLLLDSEPLWRRAEVELFGAVGVPLTEEMCARTKGLRLAEVIAYWGERYRFDADGLEARIEERVRELILTRGRALPGVLHAVSTCRSRGLQLAVASSSSAQLIAAALTRFDLAREFSALVSAEEVRLGKPHPAVFLAAAERLGVPATSCVALEDSLNGVIAAKAARMACVAVPAEEEAADVRFSIADVLLSSLEALDGELLLGLGR